MNDMSWLAQEAQNIHQYFESLFYALVLAFLLLGVFLEYFKWPLGAVPSFTPLVGRVLIAGILLHTYPEVTNLLAGITDEVSKKLGNLNEFKLVLERMGHKLDEMTVSWLKFSMKEGVTIALAFLSFFALYVSIHVAQAFLLYTWTLLYVFSPVLIALYVLPATAPATKALYRSLIEAACWKIVWSVLATLIWSTAVSNIQGPGSDVSVWAVYCFQLILAGSLLMTPAVVHALAGSGVSNMAKGLGSLAISGIATLTPLKMGKMLAGAAKRSHNAAHSAADYATQNHPKANQFVRSLPRFRTQRKPSPLTWKKKGQSPSKPENNA